MLKKVLVKLKQPKYELNMESQTNKINYQVVYTNIGRIRIKIPRLRFDSQYATKLKQLVESLQFVTSVRINPIATSIIVEYNAPVATESAVQEHLLFCIQQAAPTQKHPEPATTKVETSKLGNNSVTLGEASHLQNAAENEKGIEGNEVTESIISPLPVVTVETETSLKADRLKQSELAKRLSINTQTLTHYRSQPEFAEWSRSKDPQGIAWFFDQVSKSFYHK